MFNDDEVREMLMNGGEEYIDDVLQVDPDDIYEEPEPEKPAKIKHVYDKEDDDEDIFDDEIFEDDDDHDHDYDGGSDKQKQKNVIMNKPEVIQKILTDMFTEISL